MRTSNAILLLVVLYAAVSVAQKPKTVDDAVQVLKTKWLKPKDLEWILRNPEDEVVWTLYRPFGTALRNEFGLWGDNEPLHDSCGTKDPEGCSVVILRRLYDSVRRDADPAQVNQLDCQFKLAQTIHVSLKGFHQATTGDMVQRLQSQLNSQLSTLAASGAPVCQSSLTLEVAGKPDLGCYVVAPHGKAATNLPPSVTVTDMTLDEALKILGTLNLFRTINYPPKITLEFARRCQFPQPFPY